MLISGNWFNACNVPPSSSSADDVDAALGMGRAIEFPASEEPLYVEPEPIDGGMYDGNRTLMIRIASNKDHGKRRVC